MMEKHRDIAFDVHQLTDEKCEWVVYPKIGQGTRFSGMSPRQQKPTRRLRGLESTNSLKEKRPSTERPYWSSAKMRPAKSSASQITESRKYKVLRSMRSLNALP